MLKFWSLTLFFSVLYTSTTQDAANSNPVLSMVTFVKDRFDAVFSNAKGEVTQAIDASRSKPNAELTNDEDPWRDAFRARVIRYLQDIQHKSNVVKILRSQLTNTLISDLEKLHEPNIPLPTIVLEKYLYNICVELGKKNYQVILAKCSVMADEFDCCVPYTFLDNEVLGKGTIKSHKMDPVTGKKIHYYSQSK